MLVRRRLCYVVSVLLMLSICIPSGAARALAAGSAAQIAAASSIPRQPIAAERETDAAGDRISNPQPLAASSGLTVTSVSLSRTDFNDNGSSSELTVGFSLPDGRFAAGDTSTIRLPDGFRFLTGYGFDVTSPDGVTVARARMDAGGGIITLTYTDYVESHSDVAGTISVSITTRKEAIGDYGRKRLDLTVDGKTVPVGEVDYGHQGEDDPDEVINKWGHTSNTADRTISYTVRVNGAGRDISDAVVADTLKSPGMSYVEGSFTIVRGTLRLDPGSGAFEMTDGRDVTDQYPSSSAPTEPPSGSFWETSAPTASISSIRSGSTMIRSARRRS